ncbi:MAG: hypothetical protein LBS80_06645, partial [Tannerella sp.]|nr:hypothetical protein [Tannerella sp.]
QGLFVYIIILTILKDACCQVLFHKILITGLQRPTARTYNDPLLGRTTTHCSSVQRLTAKISNDLMLRKGKIIYPLVSRVVIWTYH